MNSNESPMQRIMREQAREEHRQAIVDAVKQGQNLRSYMEITDIFGRVDAETYTEICEDFINATDANVRAHENIMYVDPVKYKINNKQYIRIFKTPLSIEGRLFVLVKPVEHKLTKQTYFELAKIAVSAEHYLARNNVDETNGPVYAQQITLVNPDFLEKGQYKEVCRLAARTNHRALKWMQYDKLSVQDFIDVFMATATHWRYRESYVMNPAIHYLMDSDCPDWLRKECYTAYAEKYGIEGLQRCYESFTRGTNVSANEVDHGMLNDVRDSLVFRKQQQPSSRKFTFVRFDDPTSFEICCDCAESLENCPVYKQLKPITISSGIESWNHVIHKDNFSSVAQNRIDVSLPNKTDMETLKRELDNARNVCKIGHSK